MGRIQQDDLFATVIREGNLLRSGLDGNMNSYRVFEFRGKKLKLTLVEVKR